MTSTPAPTPKDLGTYPWVERTGGVLTAAERRALLRPLAFGLATHLAGRLSRLLHLAIAQRVSVAAPRREPDSVLTRACENVARGRLSPALLNHSYRTFAFGAALGELQHVDVDHELLFAAAMLHDVGLMTPTPGVDFTRMSARIAGAVAEDVGLSATATTAVQSAITLHHSPGVSLASGPAAYLLSAGAGLDVIGLRSWQLPPDVLATVVRSHPRLGFKREFSTAFGIEAAAVPGGRAAFLRRYGAFDLAIKTAPFRG
jgi:hypothetical protein